MRASIAGWCDSLLQPAATIAFIFELVLGAKLFMVCGYWTHICDELWVLVPLVILDFGSAMIHVVGRAAATAAASHKLGTCSARRAAAHTTRI